MTVSGPVATEYTIATPMPEDDVNRHLCEVQLRRRPGDRWVVHYRQRYLSSDSEWDWLLGEDDLDQWRETHWLSWETAVKLATVEVDKLSARYGL